MDRTALLICGEFRTFKLAKKYIEDSIIIPNNNVDVFIYSWKETSIGPSHRKPSRKIISSQDIVNNYINKKYYNVNIKDVCIINLRAYVLENMKHPTKCTSIFPHNKIIEKCGKDHTPVGTVYNIYLIQKAVNLMMHYENTHGFRYKNIIKIRPDAKIENDIILDGIKNDVMYFSNRSSCKTLKSDKLFWGRRDIFINFVNTLEEIKKIYWLHGRKKGIAPIGERYFHLAVNHANIKNEIVKTDLTLCRIKGENMVNCGKVCPHEDVVLKLGNVTLKIISLSTIINNMAVSYTDKRCDDDKNTQHCARQPDTNITKIKLGNIIYC